ncbi:PucR family transcriptional regulator [Lentibacillus sp. N15]|uniref:PucR family transcriptional regulator n=1 Tax=Lentibacillus songyuanensis TaxID=3136161 RepID=UPI0031BA9377
MISKFELTIRDVLQRKTFKNAKVIAGDKGLNKQVKWTHILETNQFDSLINGGELILTTGAGLKLGSSTEFRNLMNRNAAGICIEIGTHVDHISDEIIHLANEYHFPIIIFKCFVKFVDITQDLHSLIIDQHHQMLNQLNELSTKFNELSLLPNGILKILQELHTYLKKGALYITDETRSYYYPPEIKYIEENIRKRFSDLDDHQPKDKLITLDEERYALVPVKGLGQIWGYLCLPVEGNIMEEFLFSVMDRAALAIAQIMLRNRTIEERKQNREDKIVRDLLHGKKHESDELHSIFPLSTKEFYYRLILIQTNQPETTVDEDDWNETKLQRSVLFRSLFKQHGFHPVVSVSKSDTAIIASFKMKDDTDQQKHKFSSLAQAITNMQAKNIFDGGACLFGISKVNREISSLSMSYQEAKKVLFLQRANIASSIFYENIGVYQLLLDHKGEHLHTYIEDCLAPLIKYDQDTNSELLRTLEVYLDCRGSKKEAAEQLFIVRQTLYHRLRKMEELLGKDFMEPSNRLSLEMAIKAYYVAKAIY